MCLGIAGQVIEILPQSKDLARVNVFGAERMINVGLLEKDGLEPGEWVLIHVGFAIAKMEAAEAKSSIEFLEAMGQAFTNEITSALEGESEGEITPEKVVQPWRKRAS
jgi:hydrogenase expression/formation protein HypC